MAMAIGSTAAGTGSAGGSCTTGAVLRQGTWLSRMPADSANSSMLLCRAEPTPEEPSSTSAGRARAAATKAPRLRAGGFAGAHGLEKPDATSTICVRAVATSWGRFRDVAADMVSGAPCIGGIRPSGAARATASLPMVPDVPVRFSATTGCPSASVSPGGRAAPPARPARWRARRAR